MTMADRTNYLQALMHMIKGNLGAGMLAMPASFAHLGLLGGSIGLPVLCMINAYSVHLLLAAARHLDSREKGVVISDYASLAKGSFEAGPAWTQAISASMNRFVYGILLVTQVGVGCVYLVFVVDNVTGILATYDIHLSKSLVFMVIFPVGIFLSCIRTLKRLSIASTIANVLQTIGLAFILEFILRDASQYELDKREHFMPMREMALGFGSAMFAFEGISVVLPIFSRLKNPKHMARPAGVVNVSFITLLILYCVIGLFGYMKFGHQVRDSITLNMPAEPLYDAVRGMFMVSILLSYPLQLYVPNEIIWTYIKNNLLLDPVAEAASTLATVETIVPGIMIGLEKNNTEQIGTESRTFAPAIKLVGSSEPATHPAAFAPSLQVSKPNNLVMHEYACRCIIVVLTFTLAYSVPKLNLLMDLVGSLFGTILSLTLPSTIHLATFWNETRGMKRAALICVDGALILFSFIAGGFGSVISLATILKSFNLN